MEKPVLVVLARGSLGRPGLGLRRFFPGQLFQQMPLPLRQGVGDQHPHSTSKSPLREPLG